MTRERAEAWAEALGRELVTTEPAVHAALKAIAGGLDEMRAMAGLVQHLSKVVKIYQGRELEALSVQPRVYVLSREELAGPYLARDRERFRREYFGRCPDEKPPCVAREAMTRDEIWDGPLRPEAEVVREAEKWTAERWKMRQHGIKAARAKQAVDDGSEKP